MPDAVAVWKRLAMNVTSMSTPCQALLASGEVERAIAGKKQSLVLGKEPDKVFAVFFGKGQRRSAACANFAHAADRRWPSPRKTAKTFSGSLPNTRLFQRRRNRRQRPAHRKDPCKQATQLQSGGCTPPGPDESDKLRVAGSHNWRAFLSLPRQLAWADPETFSSTWSALPSRIPTSAPSTVRWFR